VPGDEWRIENAVAAAQMVGAHRTARFLVAAFRACDQADAPLDERQQAALLTGALLEFDGFEAEVRGMLVVDRLLSSLLTDGGD
jgi:hypothetical protein